MHYTIKKGLDIPITGSPDQVISTPNSVSSVAIIGTDYIDMKPTMLVSVGDKVKLGQAIFSDKKNAGVQFTSPGCGTVKSINRGDKRALQSVVIELSDESSNNSIEFKAYEAKALAGLSVEQVKQNLLDSGLWTAFRTRPYSKVPRVDTLPASIHISVMDTNPLAANPEIIIAQDEAAFKQGMQVLSVLTDTIFISKVFGSTFAQLDLPKVKVNEFSGVHPAGNSGTHIHFIDPVNANKTVWVIGYQEVIAVGKLFSTGCLSVARIIALAGPMVKNPRLIKTRLGANTDELCANELKQNSVRVISGSILWGCIASGDQAYLGRYHTQISVLQEGRERELLGWLNPAGQRFSFTNALFSGFNRKQKMSLDTSAHGSPRAIVPIGVFEGVMPLDILPTQLLRALVVLDTDVAQQLGALELDEEDLALCSFVDSGKHNFGAALRASLSHIEKEG